jgi:hypothetical protein
MWIYTTFVMDKTNVRFQLSFCLLLVIIASDYQVKLLDMNLNLALLILLGYGYFVFGQQPTKKLINSIFVSGIISLSYASFYLFAIYDPVLIIFEIKWMLAILMLILSLLFIDHSSSRISVLAIGLCHGEILYTLVILRLHPTKIIGDYYFLDVVACSLFLCSVWFLFESFVEKLQTYMQKVVQDKKTSI